MAKSLILGLFTEVAPTADALEALRKQGVSDDQMMVMSGVPYRAEMLGRPHTKSKVGWFSLVGAALGFVTALFLTAGVYMLYPIEQGGQPIIPIPPTIIILFEMTMLGTMWAAFFGMLIVNRFPVTKAPVYDERISAGMIGLQVEVDEAQVAQVETTLQAQGARELKRVAVTNERDPGPRLFWGLLLGGGAAGGLLLTLLAYAVIEIPFPTNMDRQEVITAQRGPRLAAPVGSVPIQGVALIDDQPATLPISATANSLQRGQVLYNIHCALCHGTTGKGDGPLQKYFTPKPADLTADRVQRLPPSEVFLVITQGSDPMPPLAENLNPTERWDVINYVKTLRR